MSSTPYQTTNTYYDETLSGGNTGILIGTAVTEKVGFYGITPAIQPASANQAAVTKTLVTAVALTLVTAVAITAATAIAATTFSEAKTGMWAFASSTVAKTFQARINQVVVDLATIKARVDQGKVDLATVKARVDQAKVDIAAITTLDNQIRANLVTLGIIKGAA